MALLPLLTFLCWGSFLNVVAYRLIAGGSFFSRSACPHCHMHIAWYDLIPIFSWIWLHGKCRICKNSISLLYPCIELFTAITCTIFLYTVPITYFLSYFLFITALIIVIRTDIEFMLIPQLCSIYLVPVGIILSIWKKLPITSLESILGALFGFGSLALLAYCYKKKTGITGMGDGDPELLAGIGSFIGITGVLHTLFIASMSATIYALFLMVAHNAHTETMIPFGPFLALGGIISALYFFL